MDAQNKIHDKSEEEQMKHDLKIQEGFRSCGFSAFKVFYRHISEYSRNNTEHGAFCRRARDLLDATFTGTLDGWFHDDEEAKLEVRELLEAEE